MRIRMRMKMKMKKMMMMMMRMMRMRMRMRMMMRMMRMRMRMRMRMAMRMRIGICLCVLSFTYRPASFVGQILNIDFVYSFRPQPPFSKIPHQLPQLVLFLVVDRNKSGEGKTIRKKRPTSGR